MIFDDEDIYIVNRVQVFHIHYELILGNLIYIYMINIVDINLFTSYIYV